ncbi:MAG: flagellar biosynthesis protein FlhF [Nitrospirae bacterium]|nr:flagellar biosynthesis protein FlhF [Nitrospirota bacterium]MBI3594030.1 flagellar biosynthesis protein FlhF [Nitrospirota bacterium]
MKIKKFEAAEISEALRAIREELGPDAVILSTREVAQSGKGSSVRHRVEVTAAVEFTSTVPEKTNSEQVKFDQIFQELIPKIEKGEEIYSIREELRSIKESILSLQLSPRLESNQFYGRLYDVCRDLSKVSTDSPIRTELNDLHQNGVRLYDRLLHSGVDHQTAIGLVRLMDEKISPSESEKENFYKNYLEEVIKGMVLKISSVTTVEEEPSLTLLVGPAGVGKTTTLAKLASQKVMKNQNAVMVTLDTSRIGALDQLNAFGKVIGVPVYAASSVGELKGMIARRRKRDFIFIDTPGNLNGCLNRLSELGNLKKSGTPLATHLVLSAHTREEELDEMSGRFSAVPVDQFIFTKTDETKRFGHLLSMMRKNKKSISYLTMGQRIPEDIVTATPKRVAELILK